MIKRNIRIVWNVVVLYLILISLFVAVICMNPFGVGYIAVGDISGSIGGQTLVWGNAVLVKLGAKGNVEWKIQLELGSTIYSVQKTNDGSFIAVGEIYNVSQQHGAFLAKVDSKGNKTWEKTYTDENNSYLRGRSVEETKDGGFIVTGEIGPPRQEWYTWLAKIDSKGTLEWSKTLDKGGGYFIQQLANNGYIVAGYAIPDRGISLEKTDDHGNIQWDKTLGASEYASFYALYQTGDGGYSLIGTKKVNDQGLVIWLVQMDGSGNVTRDKTLSYAWGDTGDSPYSMELAQDGGIVVITWQAKIIKIAPTGEIAWAKTASGASNLKDNEKIMIKPIGPVAEGYFVALEKDGFKLPVSPEVVSPLTSQKLIFTKFSADGDIEWDNSYNLPIKK
jgi:hypothetical protein